MSAPRPAPAPPARGRSSRLDIGALLDVERVVESLEHIIANESAEGLVAVMEIRPDSTERLFGLDDADFISWAGGFERRLLDADSRLRLAFRSADRAVAFVPGLSSRREVDPLVTRVAAALAAPMTVGATPVEVDSRAGIAVIDADNPTAERGFEAADLALSRTSPTNPAVLFRPFQRVKHAHDRRLEDRILDDLRTGSVMVRYQPMVDLTTGRADGVEALARLRDGSRGELAPGVFLPVAARHGLMGAVGSSVLSAVADNVESWQAQVVEDFTVWINLSVQEVLDETVMAAVQPLVQPSPLLHVGVELTETAHASGEELALARALLADHGLRAAIDYHSVDLVDIARNEFDTVKVGRQVMRHLEARSPFAFGSLVDLLRSLGVSVTAEGLETEAHLRPAVAAGCNRGQGFFFARPCEPQTIDGLIGSAGGIRR